LHLLLLLLFSFNSITRVALETRVEETAAVGVSNNAVVWGRGTFKYHMTVF